MTKNLNLPKKIKLVYVALKIDSAFHSQVLELLNYFSSTNNFESITLIVACKLIELKKYNLDKLKNINIVQIKTYPQLPFYLGLTKKAVTKALKKLFHPLIQFLTYCLFLIICFLFL